MFKKGTLLFFNLNEMLKTELVKQTIILKLLITRHLEVNLNGKSAQLWSNITIFMQYIHRIYQLTKIQYNPLFLDVLGLCSYYADLICFKIELQL